MSFLSVVCLQHLPLTWRGNFSRSWWRATTRTSDPWRRAGTSLRLTSRWRSPTSSPLWVKVFSSVVPLPIAAQVFQITLSLTISPQNEKEEALTTSVWIEMVTTHSTHQLHSDAFYHSEFSKWEAKSDSISLCSNGVTTGSDGISHPGQLCMGTSLLSYVSLPRAYGCQTSYWRTSESTLTLLHL